MIDLYKLSSLYSFVRLCRPGDTVQAGEDEYSLLPFKLDEKLSPTGTKSNWEIDPECLGVWYRPNFDNPVVRIQRDLHSSVKRFTYF